MTCIKYIRYLKLMWKDKGIRMHSKVHIILGNCEALRIFNPAYLHMMVLQVICPLIKSTLAYYERVDDSTYVAVRSTVKRAGIPIHPNPPSFYCA